MVSSLIPFGFLPVIAFLLVDLFAGYRKGLWAALAVGAADLGYTWSRASDVAGADWLGLGYFVLMAVLVFAALRTGDAFYFKVHGALTEFLSAAVLLTAWYAFDRALLLDLSVGQVGLDQLAKLDPRLTEDLVAEMLRLLSFQIPWWLLLHALFTFYAAVNWGKWAWAAVRIPGFLAAVFLASGFTQGAVLEELIKPLEKASVADSLKAAPAAVPALRAAPEDPGSAPGIDSLKAR